MPSLHLVKVPKSSVASPTPNNTVLPTNSEPATATPSSDRNQTSFKEGINRSKNTIVAVSDPKESGAGHTSSSPLLDDGGHNGSEQRHIHTEQRSRKDKKRPQITPEPLPAKKKRTKKDVARQATTVEDNAHNKVAEDDSQTKNTKSKSSASASTKKRRTISVVPSKGQLTLSSFFGAKKLPASSATTKNVVPASATLTRTPFLSARGLGTTNECSYSTSSSMTTVSQKDELTPKRKAALLDIVVCRANPTESAVVSDRKESVRSHEECAYENCKSSEVTEEIAEGNCKNNDVTSVKLLSRFEMPPKSLSSVAAIDDAGSDVKKTGETLANENFERNDQNMIDDLTDRDTIITKETGTGNAITTTSFAECQKLDLDALATIHEAGNGKLRTGIEANGTVDSPIQLDGCQGRKEETTTASEIDSNDDRQRLVPQVDLTNFDSPIQTKSTDKTIHGSKRTAEDVVSQEVLSVEAAKGRTMNDDSSTSKNITADARCMNLDSFIGNSLTMPQADTVSKSDSPTTELNRARTIFSNSGTTTPPGETAVANEVAATRKSCLPEKEHSANEACNNDLENKHNPSSKAFKHLPNKNSTESCHEGERTSASMIRPPRKAQTITDFWKKERQTEGSNVSCDAKSLIVSASSDVVLSIASTNRDSNEVQTDRENTSLVIDIEKEKCSEGSYETSNNKLSSSMPRRSRKAASKENSVTSMSVDVKNTATVEISDDIKILLEKHEVMRQRYHIREQVLLQQACSDDFLREDKVEIPVPKVSETDKVLKNEFPDCAVNVVACLIEGQSSSLSKLAASVLDELQQIYSDIRDTFTIENVITKMNLIGSRKNYMKKHFGNIMPGQSNIEINTFEDEDVESLWRWEVSVLDLLPEDVVSKVKKARSARRKLSSNYSAVVRLLTNLNDADRIMLSGVKSSKLDALLVKINQEEEKLLKFDRDEETKRLADEAKRAKEALREREQKAKLEQAEEKRKEIERKREEVASEKKRKEELRQKKVVEKEEQEKRELAQKEAEVAMQKKLLRSFFSTSNPKPVKKEKQNLKEKSVNVSIGAVSSTTLSTQSFNVDEFRASFDTEYEGEPREIFRSLSLQAKLSRRGRTKVATITVFVSGADPSNPFSALPYDDQQEVQVLNKYKFFRFHEDIRPPYHGTWSKKSTVITGRNPFGQDSDFLDYDNDSEGEWEEGDDDVGEELGDDNMGDEDEEKEDDGDVDEEDGWLAADDEIDEELDEETKQLRKKKMENTKEEEALSATIIPPHAGSPLEKKCRDEAKCRIISLAEETMCPAACFAFLDQHTITQLFDCDLLLDAFPPALVDESGDCPSGTADPSSYQVMSDDDMRCMARFVHNSTLGSRDKIVEELLNAHNSVTRSRAQAFRILDSIAEKKKDPLKGMFWEVRKEVLENLGLVELINTPDNIKLENMRTVALFIHNSTCSSKNKIVEELRLKHENVTASRAEAMRIFELIAVKHKHPTSGIYWQVKDDIREKLGLNDILSLTPPSPASQVVSEIPSETERENKAVESTTATNLQRVASASDDARVNKEQSKNLDTQLSSLQRSMKRMRSPQSTGDDRNPADTNFADITSKSDASKSVPAGSVKILESFLIKKKPRV